MKKSGSFSPPGCLTDESLIRDFLGGDAGAFDRLVLKHQNAVFTLCYRMLGDYDEANDCAQEVFIKVYRKLHTFEGKSQFSTWLYRIAVNTCKNAMDSSWRRMRKKMVNLDEPAFAEGRPRDIGDRTWNPVRMYERDENEARVRNAIASLPEKQRVLVVLRDIEGKGYEEIAEITGMKIGTVKSKLARGRDALRSLLRGVV